MLLPRCVTIAEVLGSQGYFTAMTGKWHLGQQHGCVPWEHGFMRSLNSRYGEVYFPIESNRPGAEILYLNGKENPEKHRPFSALIGIRRICSLIGGLKFIDEARAEKKPFSSTSPRGRFISRCALRRM